MLHKQPDIAWPAFKADFLKEFGTVSDQAAVILEQQCFMQEGEPISTYIHHVRDIFDRLNYDEGECLRRFMHCVDADLKREDEQEPDHAYILWVKVT